MFVGLTDLRFVVFWSLFVCLFICFWFAWLIYVYYICGFSLILRLTFGRFIWLLFWRVTVRLREF